jgi:hypothetical protein
MTIGNDVELWEGEWFEIAHDTTYISVSTKRKRIKDGIFSNVDDTPNQLGELNDYINKAKAGYDEPVTLTSDTILEPLNAAWSWFLLDASGGAIEIILYPAADYPGSELKFSVTNFDNTVKLTPDSDTINGSSEFNFEQLYETLLIKSDGSNWIIIFNQK